MKNRSTPSLNYEYDKQTQRDLKMKIKRAGRRPFVFFLSDVRMKSHQEKETLIQGQRTLFLIESFT
jgi:hypothetical protein